MRNRGFTMLELTISMSILSIVTALGFVAVSSSVSSVALARAKADAQDNVRSAVAALTNELQIAGKKSENPLSPNLEGMNVKTNPVAGAPIEIAFQVPESNTAAPKYPWSTVITYRFINEDANGNGRLDAGEDTDSDHVLTRRFVRMQDLNGDGDTNDAGEIRPVASANNLSNVQFAVSGNEVTISITATSFSGTQRSRAITSTLTKHVYLLN